MTEDERLDLIDGRVTDEKEYGVEVVKGRKVKICKILQIQEREG